MLGLLPKALPAQLVMREHELIEVSHHYPDLNILDNPDTLPDTQMQKCSPTYRGALFKFNPGDVLLSRHRPWQYHRR